jgi:hypothetical protein
VREHAGVSHTNLPLDLQAGLRTISRSGPLGATRVRPLPDTSALPVVAAAAARSMIPTPLLRTTYPRPRTA